jgi:hypothetical protein
LLHNSLIHFISITHSLWHLLKPFELEILTTWLRTLLRLCSLLVRILLRRSSVNHGGLSIVYPFDSVLTIVILVSLSKLHLLLLGISLSLANKCL